MNWNTNCANPLVVDAFNDYRDLLFRIATLYAGSRLIETVDWSALDPHFGLALSNDFSEGYTTVRTIGDLEASIKTGDYAQLALGLGTLQLCTAFEILFDRLADAYGVSVTSSDSFIATDWTAVGGSVKLGNKALMQIRKIHVAKALDTPLNTDGTLIKLAAIIEVRNCMAHSGGVVETQKAKDRLWAYKIASEIGKRLSLRGNHLDDFLHFMAINVRAFVNNAP